MRAPAPPLAVPLARRRPSRPWAALLVSAVLHLLLAAAIVVRAVPEETEGQPGEEARPAEPAREVRMVYVPPAPEPTPLPPPPPPPPAPRQRPEEVALGPDSDRPDEPPRDAARDPRDDEPTGRPDGELDPERQAPAAAAPRRIQTAAESFSRFSGLANLLGLGRRPQAERQEEFDGPAEQRSLGDALTLGAPRLGPSELDERRWTSSNPSAAGQCPEIPDLGLNEDGTPVLASVVGAAVMASSRDLLAMLVGLALVSAPAFLRAGWREGDLRRRQLMRGHLAEEMSSLD